MMCSQVIDLKNETRAVPISIEGGIVMHDPFPEGGDVSIRLLKLSPGATTCRHNHTEVEFWTVISGGVRIHLDEKTFLLLGGESIRMDPLSRHRIEALDSGAVMQTVWWHSRAAFEEATSTNEAIGKSRPLLLVPAMLTPNGNMHIGHASGPFLYADVLRRIAETGGREVFVLQGTHGHLEHIAIAADAAGLEYYQLAEKNTASFQEALHRLNAVSDIFLGTKPDRRGKAVVLEVFERLCSKGLIAEREHLVPYDVQSGRFKVDAFVHGKCPYCGGYSSGHECEDCGALVLDAELQDPVDLDGRSLERRPLKRLFLNLAPLHDALESFASRNFLPIYAKLYVESWLSRGLPAVCISNPNREGIRIPIPGFECQRFTITMEHVPRHLLALETIREKSGCPAFWYQIPRDEMPELDILFGADNAFGRLLVIPGVLSALDLHEMLPRRIFVNQMLTLEGKKFSTSRNHAIWVNDIAAEETAEPLRFYLCRCRPDGSVEDFSMGAYESWKRDFWDGRLSRSVAKANEVIGRVATDELPCPGQWSATDIAFLADCTRFNAEVRARFEADYPDVRQLTRAIEAFVDAIDRYSCSVLQVPAAPKVKEALARTAARAVTFALVGLCVATYPVVPDFAISIARSLGLEAPKLSWFDRDWMAEPVRLSASHDAGGR